jgi:hypothetical protein
MDFSKFKTYDWLMIGGGLGMLIFGLFLDWLSAGPFSAGNAFDFFFTGTIPWLLLVAVAVLVFLKVQGTLGDNLPWSLIFLGATGLSVLLLLIRLLFNPGVGEGVDRGSGMYLSVLSGIVSLVGAFMAFQAGGGNVKDLTDMNKLKGSFSTGSGSSSTGDTPPPPPPTV